MKENPRVCIDPGHGGSQPGAVYHDLQEKDVVLKVCNYAKEELIVLDSKIWCCLTREFDKTVSLEERCRFANNTVVDCFISVHANADPDEDYPGMPEAKGEEIWVYDDSIWGMKLAQCLKDEVDWIFPNEPFRGIKKTRPIGADKKVDRRQFLYVISYTDAPAVLVEIGFIDKSSSTETFSNEETLRKIGGLIADGIYKFIA